MISYRQFAKIFYRPYADIIWQYPPHQKTIYLTFDDGPYPPLTGKLLEMLNGQQIPASFFLSGENVFKYRHELDKLDYSHHTIGNHLFHHIPLWGLDTKTLFKQIKFTDQLIFQYMDRSTQIFRPPYGMFTPSLFPLLDRISKKLVLWSIMAYDFKWKTNEIITYLLKSVRPGDIIVFHDSLKTENILLKVLSDFIDFIRQKEWNFGKILLK